MKIGVLAHEMEGARTGVGRYLEGLLAGLKESDCRWRFELLLQGDPFEHELWGDRIEPVFDRRPNAHPVLWEQLRGSRLLAERGVDAIFSPAYSLPLRLGVPGLVTVHDLSFEHLGGEFSWKERWRRRFLARSAVRRATRVLADTSQIARELEVTYNLPTEKVAIVPLGIDDKFLLDTSCDPAVDDALLKPYGIAPPYLLYLGSILPRRQVDLVVAAFSEVAAAYPDLRLVLAGANRLRHPGDLQRWIDASGFAERISLVGYVAEEALPALYRRAELTYYLSTYEGYGLPPLESLAGGTPAIVGDGLALDDLWPDYLYRCQRLEPGEVVRVTQRALGDAEERRQVAEEGVERMARLTWRHAAELFVAEISRALRG
jgi:glycosyltransferase involved in cell wall biosynthesis